MNYDDFMIGEVREEGYEKVSEGEVPKVVALDDEQVLIEDCAAREEEPVVHDSPTSQFILQVISDFVAAVSSLPPNAAETFMCVQANLTPHLLLTYEPTAPPTSLPITSNLPIPPNSPKLPTPSSSLQLNLQTLVSITHLHQIHPFIFPTGNTDPSLWFKHLPPPASLEMQVQQALNALTTLSADVAALKIDQSLALDSLKFQNNMQFIDFLSMEDAVVARTEQVAQNTINDIKFVLAQGPTVVQWELK